MASSRRLQKQKKLTYLLYNALLLSFRASNRQRLNAIGEGIHIKKMDIVPPLNAINFKIICLTIIQPIELFILLGSE